MMDFDYWIEIVTSQILFSHIEKNKENFIKPGYTCVSVRELTLLVIRKALEVFAVDKEEAFWLKLHHI